MKSRLLLSSVGILGLLAGGCDDSGADGASEAAAEFTAAAEALEARFETGVPAASDPAVAAFEAQTARALDTLGTDALPLDGFDSYDRLCGKTATIVQRYVGAGGASDTEALTRNIETYFDQIFTPLLFSAHCSAAHMPFIEEEAKDDVATNAAALGQVRAGVYGQVMGLLQMAGDPMLEAERRARIVALLAADAGDFAIVLSAAQRRELANAASAIAPTLAPADGEKAQAVAAALTGAPCAELCRF